MQIVKLGEQLNCPVVLCLGFFGTMHKGHAELLSRAKMRARMTNAKVALFTFDNNHLAVLKRDESVVYTYDERLSIYQSLGVDYVITANFNDNFKSLTGKEFLSKLSNYDLDCGIFCGFDYRCGSDRLDALGIRKYFKQTKDYPVYIVEQIDADGEKVSTSLIKKYISSNRIDKANGLLSEPFFVDGKVIHGRGVGKTLGYPTANVAVPAEKILPVGVFSANVNVDGTEYRAIVNIGNAPTFGVASKTLEAHLINFNGDLYGKTLKISLLKYLRSITKFNSAEELRAQLKKDTEAALND